jgi:hypothetical protein
MNTPSFSDMKTHHNIAITLALTFTGLVLFCIWDEELKFLVAWALHLVPTALIGVPLWYFNRHRVRWGSLDFLIIILPFLLYLVAAVLLPRPKGWGNLVELIVLGCCLPLSPLTRVLAVQIAGSKGLAACLLVLLCLLAIALHVFVPFLPE